MNQEEKLARRREKKAEIRRQQKLNADKYHNPKEKMNQLDKLSLEGEVLEVFAGEGNLTKYYEGRGCKVTAMTKKLGNSFDYIYVLRGKRKKYDVIDIDSYGYPDRFFPVVFEMMRDECLLIFTFPIVGINILNGIVEQHFSTFYGGVPTIGDVVGRITDWALREWRLASLVDVVKIKRIYRFVFLCNRVKATELCNVRNRP